MTTPSLFTLDLAVGMAMQGRSTKELLPLLGDPAVMPVDCALRFALAHCVATRDLPLATAMLFLEDFELAESYLIPILGREVVNALLWDIQRRMAEAGHA